MKNIAIHKRIHLEFDKVQDNYIVSEYLPTKHLFITKEKKVNFIV